MVHRIEVISTSPAGGYHGDDGGGDGPPGGESGSKTRPTRGRNGGAAGPRASQVREAGLPDYCRAPAPRFLAGRFAPPAFGRLGFDADFGGDVFAVGFALPSRYP